MCDAVTVKKEPQSRERHAGDDCEVLGDVIVRVAPDVTAQGIKVSPYRLAAYTSTHPCPLCLKLD